MLIRRHFVPSAGVPVIIPGINQSYPGSNQPTNFGATIKFTASATDVESDPIEYRFYLNRVPQTEFSSTNYWEWVTDEDDVGPHTVTVYVETIIIARQEMTLKPSTTPLWHHLSMRQYIHLRIMKPT